MIKYSKKGKVMQMKSREDRKWESINDMLREAFPEKSELRKAVSGITEK